MRRGLALLLVALPVAALAAAGNGWVQIPGGSFRSALKYEDVRETVVAPFGLQKRPVTNAEFLAFVKAHPQWRPDRFATVLAETRYLAPWQEPEPLSEHAQPEQPARQVRWSAPSADCEAHGARRPPWSEGGDAAAADK